MLALALFALVGNSSESLLLFGAPISATVFRVLSSTLKSNEVLYGYALIFSEASGTGNSSD